MINRASSFTVAATIGIALLWTADVACAESRLAQRSGATIEVLVDGVGPLVLMIPSLGRGAEDFDELSHAVVAAGYRVARLQPRGVGHSTGVAERLSMRDLADDAAAGVEAAGGGPAVVLGHAFGQRVARMIAAAHPDKVRAIIALAAGGKASQVPRAAKALTATFDESLSEAEHLEAVRTAFFAPGNDPAVWRAGWYPATMKMQRQANASSVDDWWSGGGTVPILVVQGLQDQIATPENGRMLKTEAPDRVELVELDGAAHALLPEKPAEIAQAVTAFLNRVTGQSR
jgi:pimeloyl-ACP methyl ester carboxylesterase